jgi:chromate transporter
VSYGDLPWVAALFFGIKPAVIAIVLQAVHRIGSRTLRHPSLWAIAAVSFFAIWMWHIPFPWIVLAAAITGAVFCRAIMVNTALLSMPQTVWALKLVKSLLL